LKQILFVCSGNTCRSPLAEVIARDALRRRGIANVRVSSAGTSAVDGMPASEGSLAVARQNGLNLSSHRSRLLSPAIVRDADLIVALAKAHRHTVGIVEPAALDWTRLLTDFSVDHDGDVDDPVGGDIRCYEKTFHTIYGCVEDLAAQLDRFDGWRRPAGE